MTLERRRCCAESNALVVGLLALALLPLLAACEGAVDPVSTAPPEPFVLYGVLDVADGAHRVRVEAVRRVPERPPVPEPGVTATLVDEATGRRTDGTPERVQLPDGTEAGAFSFAVALAPGRRYRLDLAAPDGRTAEATTTVPPARAATVLAADRDSLRRDAQGVVWAGLDRSPTRVLVRYRLLSNDAPTDTTVIAIESAAGSPAQGGWRTDVPYTLDADVLSGRLARPRSDFRLVGVDVEIGERSAEGARRGAYGFFGSVGASRVRFVPPRAVVERLGFRV